MANIQHVAQKLAVEWKVVLQISVSQKAAFGRCRHSFVGSLLTRLGSITGTVPLGTIMAAIQSPSPSACQRTIGPLATDVRDKGAGVQLTSTRHEVGHSCHSLPTCTMAALSRKPEIQVCPHRLRNAAAPGPLVNRLLMAATGQKPNVSFQVAAAVHPKAACGYKGACARLREVTSHADLPHRIWFQ